MTAAEVIAYFQLKPHVQEGGYFRETYQSAARHGRGAFSTAIYFLLTPQTRSHLHRLPTDEVYHFYLGDPVELVQLFPDGSGQVTIMGQDVRSGEQVQHVIPVGVWQGSRLRPGGQWALFGTTMAPGFVADEFVLGKREELIQGWPSFAEWIRDLTTVKD
jgi:predicted cupin superfamily sugar epimerase